MSFEHLQVVLLLSLLTASSLEMMDPTVTYGLGGEANSCQQPCIYLSNSSNIFAVDASFKNQKPTSVISEISTTVALDVHFNHRLIFWTNKEDQTIRRSNIDGSNKMTIAQDWIGLCNGIAVEWSTDHIYWTDTAFDKIEVSRLDGSRRKVLITDHLDRPSGIALDPQSGFMFWTDWGSTPKIERAYLNGENRQAIVTSSIVRPKGITLDHWTQKIYWVDAKTSSIETADYSGLNRRKLFSHEAIYPFDVDISGPWLFWTDWNTVHELHKLDKTTGKLEESFKIGASAMGLAVYDSARQPPVVNGCQRNNGDCSYLCLLKPNGYTCACPNGMALGDNGKTCSIPVSGCQQPCLYLSNGTHIMTISASLKHQPLPVIYTGLAIAVDIHISRGVIFWSDEKDHSIKRANVNGSNIKAIVQDRIGVCTGIAVEWSTDLLYWIDSTFIKIEVSRLDGSRRKELITDNLDRPRGIALDPKSGLMFWTDWSSTPKIERSQLNGQSRQVVVTSSLGRPNGITLDYHRQHIYWVDAETSSIETADYYGLNRRQLFSYNKIYPFDVAISGPWLYWTDWKTDIGLHQMNKTSGKLHFKRKINGMRFGLTVNDVSKQPLVVNGCQRNNGGCSYLCLLKPNGYTCACSNGMTLGDDGKTCIIPGRNCPKFVPKPNTQAVKTCMSKSGSKCLLRCNIGYSLSNGTTIIKCLRNGRWSSKGPSCTDMQPPAFNSCPSNIVKFANENRTTLISWTIPNATDNSGIPPNITQLSGLDPPVSLDEGLHHITYTATDEAKNKAICSFTAEVKVIRCNFSNSDGILQENRCENHYGSKCSFQCPHGYRLVGTPTLKCLATNGGPPGIWDSPLPNCEAVYCPVLTAPANAIKSNCYGQVNESMGTTCQFACIHGYQPSTLQKRVCLGNEAWSGKELDCKPVTCSPLVNPAFGTITPSTCTKGGFYNDICHFACLNGFRINGTAMRTCAIDGRWTGLNDTYCLDVSPPSFSNTCPKDKVIQLESCSRNITVNWTIPVATDNSGIVEVQNPSLEPPVVLSRGVYTINYTAVDATRNYKSCVLKIQVERRSCGNLLPPTNGEIASFSCNDYAGSVATVACKPGYSINGAKMRTCMSNGQWSGVSTKCTRVTCKPLQPLKFGNITPKICTSGLPVVFGTQCFFQCNTIDGFQNVGLSRAVCTVNGSWSVDTNKIFCKDIKRPDLVCPGDAIVATEERKAFGTFSWDVPVPQDNSGENLTLNVSNGISPPHRFHVGKTVVRYSTQDSAGLQTSCEFKVTVLDKEPPKRVKCLTEKEIRSSERNTKVYFPEVVFRDNVGIKEIVTNRENGSTFTWPWGLYDIVYTAFDKAGNKATCIMRLAVISKVACERPSPPANGAIACDNQLVSMFCTAHCNPGFIFAVQPTMLACSASNGIWLNGKRKPDIPDCSEKKSSPDIGINVKMVYLVKSCKKQNHDEIKKKFLQVMKSIFQQSMGDYCFLGNCKLDNIHVKCGKSDNKRRRRSTVSLEKLEIDFKMKIPFPKNSSSNVNTTLEEVQSSVVQTLNSSASSLEVNGLNLTLGKAPTSRVERLTCGEGQVLKGSSCVTRDQGPSFDSLKKMFIDLNKVIERTIMSIKEKHSQRVQNPQDKN